MLKAEDAMPTLPPTVPYAMLASTEYGMMILHRYDINQTGALLRTGRAYHHGEIELLRRLLTALPTQDRIVLDVGANLGTHTLGLASCVGAGAVHAFEPQRVICNMLAGSVALNGLRNVFVHNVAIGATQASIEVPQFDYDAPLNFGSIEFGAAQREPLDQQRGRDPKRVERVQQRSIDSYDFDNVELIKLDVEGMELSAIEGAGATIDRCRPMLYVEYLKTDRDDLERQIVRFDYAIHVHGDNLLCLPHELRDIRI